MPWTPKQNKLFRAAEHNAAFAKKVGIKQSDATRMAHEGIKQDAGKLSTLYKKKRRGS